jgi:hypothetical protein
MKEYVARFRYRTLTNEVREVCDVIRCKSLREAKRLAAMMLGTDVRHQWMASVEAAQTEAMGLRHLYDSKNPHRCFRPDSLTSS